MRELILIGLIVNWPQSRAVRPHIPRFPYRYNVVRMTRSKARARAPRKPRQKPSPTAAPFRTSCVLSVTSVARPCPQGQRSFELTC